MKNNVEQSIRNFFVFNRKRIFWFLFILSITTSTASIAHLTYRTSKSDNPIAQHYPAPIQSDAWEYATIAKNLVNRGEFTLNTEPPYEKDTFRTPGYIFFVAVFYKIFGSFYPVLFAQAVISFLTCLIIFEIGKKMVGWKIGLAVSVLYIVDPNTMVGTSYLFSENLFMLFFLSCMWVLLFSEIKNISRRWAVAGLLFGIAALIRPIILYLPVVLLPSYLMFEWVQKKVDLKQILKSFAIFLLAFFAVISPWYIRNYQVSGVWGMSSNGTYTLFRENLPRFLSTITPGNPNFKKILMDRAGLTQEVVPRGLEYSEQMGRVVKEIVFEHPVRYGIYHVSSLASFFLNSGVHHYMKVSRDMVDSTPLPPEPGFAQAVTNHSIPLLIVVLKNHGFELIENFYWLAIFILCALSSKFSKDPARMRFFISIIIYFALITGPISHARYRIPVTPFLLLGAAMSVQYFVEKRIKR